MGTPHKHAEIIKAWADGADLQYRHAENFDWQDYVFGTGRAFILEGNQNLEWRIKPPKKTPGQILYESVPGETSTGWGELHIQYQNYWTNIANRFLEASKHE